MFKKLREIYIDAAQEKEKILKALEPLREKEALAIKKLHQAQAELKAIRIKIAKYEEKKGLADVSRAISTLAPKAEKLTQ